MEISSKHVQFRSRNDWVSSGCFFASISVRLPRILFNAIMLKKIHLQDQSTQNMVNYLLKSTSPLCMWAAGWLWYRGRLHLTVRWLRQMMTQTRRQVQKLSTQYIRTHTIRVMSNNGHTPFLTARHVITTWRRSWWSMFQTSIEGSRTGVVPWLCLQNQIKQNIFGILWSNESVFP